MNKNPASDDIWQRFMETTNVMIVRASAFGPMRADRFVFPSLRLFRWLPR